MRRIVLASLAIFTFTIFFSDYTLGCECVPPPLEKPSAAESSAALVKDFNGAAAIFSGKLVEADRLKLKFKVDKVWKGDVGKEFVISTGAKRYDDESYVTSSCDYNFKLGEKYLIFAYPVNPDLHPGSTDLQARECTRTKLLKDAHQDIEMLEQIQPVVWRNMQRATVSA
jgi:hypothetical protein